jgi:hypothetical protein
VCLLSCRPVGMAESTLPRQSVSAIPPMLDEYIGIATATYTLLRYLRDGAMVNLGHEVEGLTANGILTASQPFLSNTGYLRLKLANGISPPPDVNEMVHTPRWCIHRDGAFTEMVHSPRWCIHLHARHAPEVSIPQHVSVMRPRVIVPGSHIAQKNAKTIVRPYVPNSLMLGDQVEFAASERA